MLGYEPLAMASFAGLVVGRLGEVAIVLYFHMMSALALAAGGQEVLGSVSLAGVAAADLPDTAVHGLEFDYIGVYIPESPPAPD